MILPELTLSADKRSVMVPPHMLREGMFACVISGGCMDSGEIPTRICSGDMVVCYPMPLDEAAAHVGELVLLNTFGTETHLLKQLHAIHGSYVVLRQYNPHVEIMFHRGEVRSIYNVVGVVRAAQSLIDDAAGGRLC